SYGIGKGLIYSFPCVCKNGDWEIVQGLSINEFSRGKMQATEKELQEDREAVKELLPEYLRCALKKRTNAVAFLFVGVGLCFGDRSGGVCGRWWVSDYASLIRPTVDPTYGQSDLRLIRHAINPTCGGTFGFDVHSGCEWCLPHAEVPLRFGWGCYLVSS